jgi:hypothetical protein
MIEVMLDSVLVGLQFAAILLGWALLSLLVIRAVSGPHRRGMSADREPAVIVFDEHLVGLPVASAQRRRAASGSSRPSRAPGARAARADSQRGRST